jgi:hypothetical protein
MNGPGAGWQKARVYFHLARRQRHLGRRADVFCRAPGRSHWAVPRPQDACRPWSTTSRCRTTCRSATSSCSTPCSPQGNSAAAAITRHQEPANQSSIKFAHLVWSVAPEGIATHSTRHHPDVAGLSPLPSTAKLNDHGYILPGLGDAGDRMFGTQVTSLQSYWQNWPFAPVYHAQAASIFIAPYGNFSHA